ncbi:MAG: leucyl/phenylalanyl-tRNA--protein transferase [Pseudomonadota bacterium]
MIELFKLDHSLNFPAHQFALDEPNGLLAFGGDLSPERLIFAYKHGIFPWFSKGEPILWWTPDPRGVIYTDTFKASRSLRKSIRKYGYRATMNHAFKEVITACATVSRRDVDHTSHNGTWITDEMIHAYIELHYSGYAHSVEIWDADNKLAGGLYGIGINAIFCGESMFHNCTDASKAAFLALVNYMKANDMPLIDCQMNNQHLKSLGCVEIPRDEFLADLNELINRQSTISRPWQTTTLSL